MAYIALSELVVVFSKQLKLKIHTKVGFANSASDLFSIFRNLHISYLFCNVHMSLQCLLPSTTALPPIRSCLFCVFVGGVRRVSVEAFRANRVHRKPLLFLEGLLAW